MKNNPNWSALFAYIDYFDAKPDTKWGGGEKMPNGATSFPFPIYSEEVEAFICKFNSMHLADENYMDTIKNHSLEPSHDSFDACIERADLQLLLAMLTCYIQQERFCDGLIASAIKNGNIAKILNRLKQVVQGESK